MWLHRIESQPPIIHHVLSNAHFVCGRVSIEVLFADQSAAVVDAAPRGAIRARLASGDSQVAARETNSKCTCYKCESQVVRI
jgi:hypothetical protein